MPAPKDPEFRRRAVELAQSREKLTHLSKGLQVCRRRGGPHFRLVSYPPITIGSTRHRSGSPAWPRHRRYRGPSQC
jgi:hypothetical protein